MWTPQNVTTTYRISTGSCHASAEPIEQILRTAITSYLIISSSNVAEQRWPVAGFRLKVRPTVFHPRYFLTSEFFADFLSGTDLVGKWVAGVGMGSAILALAAARAGAASVVALDINSNACNEREPQRHNGLGPAVHRLDWGVNARPSRSELCHCVGPHATSSAADPK
jgi:methylase of polypeptide subunit release factors